MSLPVSTIVPLSSMEKQWLLNRAWTCINYQQPGQACVLLECLLEQCPGYLPAEKMLLVAYLNNTDYQKVTPMAEKLLTTKHLSESDKSAIYFCLSRALMQTGDIDGAKANHHSYLELLNQ